METLSAADSVHVDHTFTKYSPATELSYFHPDRTDFPDNQVIQQAFTTCTRQYPSFGLKNGLYWFKVTLHSSDSLPIPLVLGIKTARITSISLFEQKQDQLHLIEARNWGDLGLEQYAFHQQQQKGSKTYYFKVLFERESSFPLTLYHQRTFLSKEQFALLKMGVYYMLCILFIIISLVFYFKLKVYYSLFYTFVLISLMLCTAIYDSLHVYFLQNAFLISHYDIAARIMLTLSFILFLRSVMVQTEEIDSLPRTVPILLIISIGLYLLFAYNGQFIYYSLADIAALTLLSVLIAKGYALSRRHHYIFPIVVGSVILLGGTTISLLAHEWGYIDMERMHNFNRFFSVIEMFCMNYSIILHIIHIQSENAQMKSAIKDFVEKLQKKPKEIIKEVKVVKKVEIIKEVEVIKEVEIVKEVEKKPTPDEKNKALGLNALSPREMEVVDLIVKGMSNTQIADNLFISTNTVKYHTRNIYEKLNVKNRTQVASHFK